MYARVATFEGGSDAALRAAADEINSNATQGPPPGVPATGMLMLIDPDSGKSMSIVLFDSEEDMRAGGAGLEAMTPTEDAGRRTSVETYEVGVDIRMPGAAPRALG
jgi:hypothetical protein